jgi:4-nitrophenyl phosphatase
MATPPESRVVPARSVPTPDGNASAPDQGAPTPARSVSSEVIERLRATRGFVLDLDGTLARGDSLNRGLQAEPGAVQLLQLLQNNGVPWVIFTNGTVRTPLDYVPKLRALGFPVEVTNIMTPSVVAASLLVRRGVRRVMTLGVEGVWRPLADAGLDIVHSTTPNPGAVDAIYVGWYREFGMADIEAACAAIEAGAALYSASGTPFFTTATGRAPGTSLVICAALEVLTGRRAEIVGKPSLHALECAGERLGVPMAEIAIAGDDPLLEVPMAHGGGALAIYVDSGVAGPEPFAGVADELQPHIYVHGVAELLPLLADRSG